MDYCYDNQYEPPIMDAEELSKKIKLEYDLFLKKPKEERDKINEAQALTFILKFVIRIIYESDELKPTKDIRKTIDELLNTFIIESLNLDEKSMRVVTTTLDSCVNMYDLKLEQIKSREEKLDMIEKNDMESREKDKIISNLSSAINEISSNDVDKINLQEIYFDSQEDFRDWINSHSWVYDTKVRHINKNHYIFVQKNIKYLREYYELSKLEEISTIKQFRKFIEYCKCKGKITFNQSSAIMSTINSNLNSNKEQYDDYIPTYEEMKDSIDTIRNVINEPIKDVKNNVSTSEIDLLLYMLSIESGARWASIEKELLKNFDETKITIYGDVAIYNIKKNKQKKSDKKNGAFIFCRTKTLTKIVEIYKKNPSHFKDNILRDFKRRLNNRTNNKLVDFKYHRKYGKSLMNSKNIDFNNSEFIQSRISSNVGWRNYSQKIEPCVKDYKKILPHLIELLD